MDTRSRRARTCTKSSRRSRGSTRCPCGARANREPEARSDRAGVEDPGDRWRGGPRRVGTCARRTLEPGRGADRAGHRARRTERRDAGVHDRRRLPDGVPDPPAGRPGSGAVWPVHELPRGAATRAVDELVRAAVSFLRRDLRLIKPRIQWAAARWTGWPQDRATNKGGMALCVYGDAGWGREVERGRRRRGSFSQELVTPRCGRSASDGARSRHRPGSRPPIVEAGASRSPGSPARSPRRSGYPTWSAHRRPAPLPRRRWRTAPAARQRMESSGWSSRPCRRPGPARRRHRGLRLDADRGRPPSANARQRSRVSVRAGGRRSARLMGRDRNTRFRPRDATEIAVRVSSNHDDPLECPRSQAGLVAVIL